MKRTAMLAAAALALSACSTTTGSLDATIRDGLIRTCPLIETGYAAFTVATASGDIRETTIRKVDAAYAGVKVMCAAPAEVTAADALVRAAAAYATISAALKEAKAGR
ncbi:cell wall anchor protein [Rhizobium sp. CSW-27]|uniref:cell wall anchor protein n=1 Tax=Rhizobium sp. CSW-27 TaxID=2839985 RepID=UPI001C01FA35|nr:cell wall anchor protein [Rhizobium sp. CSW-27]MBT9370260.1 cell wall anchor protein [Rhizobium sp. CSW-27]